MEQEFSARWVEVGAHWGSSSMLLVHGWLMTQSQPVSTDDAMNVQLTVAMPTPCCNRWWTGSWCMPSNRCVPGKRYVAETDGFAMLLAVVKKRRNGSWCPSLNWLIEPTGGPIEGDANQAEFLDRLHAMADQAQRLNNAVERRAGG